MDNTTLDSGICMRKQGKRTKIIGHKIVHIASYITQPKHLIRIVCCDYFYYTSSVNINCGKKLMLYFSVALGSFRCFSAFMLLGI